MSTANKIYIDWPPNRSGFVVGSLAPFNACEHEYIGKDTHKEELEAQYNKLTDAHDKEIDALDDAYRKKLAKAVKEAEERTRRECADAFINHGQHDPIGAILNAGKDE